jgi:hypothetical protein
VEEHPYFPSFGGSLQLFNFAKVSTYFRTIPVLSFPKIQHLVWGGKGVGSQGDGSAQFVAKGEQEREVAIEILKELDVECFKLDIKNSNERIAKLVSSDEIEESC